MAPALSIRPAIVDGDLPCYTLIQMLEAGQLSTKNKNGGEEVIRTRVHLSRLTDISQSKMSKVLLERKRMFAPVQSKGGKPRWQVICEVTGQAASALFPELPFDEISDQSSSWLNRGEARELVPASGAGQIEIQPLTGGLYIRLNGVSPTPATLGFLVRHHHRETFRLTGKTVWLTTSLDAPDKVRFEYRWLR